MTCCEKETFIEKAVLVVLPAVVQSVGTYENPWSIARKALEIAKAMDDVMEEEKNGTV